MSAGLHSGTGEFDVRRLRLTAHRCSLTLTTSGTLCRATTIGSASRRFKLEVLTSSSFPAVAPE